MPTAFVTGITGQTGSYLAEQLISDGWHVTGMFREHDAETAAFLAIVPDAHLVQGDLGAPAEMGKLIADIEPDAIFNLGGLSSVASSWEDPARVGLINGVAAAAMLGAAQSLRDRAQRPVAFVQASSAEIFGYAVEKPQSESTPVRPTNPYGASKAYAHHLVGVYRERGLEASSCILYNHESPRRPETFVTRKITRGVAAISLGKADR
ncbi:MAG: GDP-mannose 4,6-dehydratase, partial [Cryobacterium sp.]|nr:GDP-mannose 4,6-dehydratase [Cryobacterium sp.]